MSFNSNKLVTLPDLSHQFMRLKLGFFKNKLTSEKVKLARIKMFDEEMFVREKNQEFH